MSGDPALPGYSRGSEVGERALLLVKERLLDSGFKYMEVDRGFDDGLDLMVSPHDGHNVLPAIAGIQVRGRRRGSSIAVERHGRYWAELNMPVFGVLVTPDGAHWNELGEYLRNNPGAKSIPADRPFDSSFGEALRQANHQLNVMTATLNLGRVSNGRDQATAVTALRTMHDNEAVATLLRCTLPALQPVACRLALNHLALLPKGIKWTPPIDPYLIKVVLEHLHEFDFDDAPGNDGELVLFEGAGHLLDLIKRTDVAAETVLEAAFLTWDQQAAYVALHLAICRASDQSGKPAQIIQEFLRRRPDMREDHNVQEIMLDWNGDSNWVGFDYNY